MELIDKIRTTIEPSITDMGYDIVLLKMSEGKHKGTLVIMAERKDGAGMMIEDCEKISRQVSALLDVEDLIEKQYDLEVSSPGIDRPLTRIKDFTDYVGHEVKVETALPVDGRKRYRGEIVGVEAENIILNVAGLSDRQPVSFSNIRSAKLVLTDKLIKQVTGN